MYISQFVCGIFATILSELALLIIYTIYLNRKEEKKNERIKDATNSDKSKQRND